MKIFPNRGKDNKDKSLGLLHGEAASGSMENAGAAYQANSVIATGADAGTVALLSAAVHLSLSFLLIKVPALAEKQHNLKRTTITIALINTLTWLPVVLVLALFNKLNPYLLIFLWVFNLVPSILIGPLRDNWMSNLIPSEKMGQYLSWRSAIGSVFYLGTFIAMGFILDNSMTTGYRNFAIVTAIALLGSSASSVIYSKLRQSQPQATTTKKENLGFITFLKETRHSHLGTFIIFMSLFTLVVNLSSPLLSAYMINTLKFSYMTYTAMISCEYVARILSLSFWGKQIDKSGSLHLMMKVAHLIPFVPILWMFSRNIFYLGAVQLFSGMVWAAFDLCAQAFMFKATSPEQRLRYIAYQRSLTTFSVAIGAISGALLLNGIFPIFGSQILGVFLVSGILRMVVARVMLPRLQPGAIPDAIVHEELAIELARLNLANREGLYYHPERWQRLTKPVAAFGTIIGKAVNKIAPRPAGLYYNPQQWSEYAGLQSLSVQPNDNEVAKGALYHDKKAWSKYMKQTSILMKANIQPGKEVLLHNHEAWSRLTNHAVKVERMSGENAELNRNGLFYDTQRWGDYLKTSLVLNATTMRTNGGSLTNRQPIFYHPEMWGNYKNQSALSRTVTARVDIGVNSSRKPLFYHPEEWDRAYDPAMVHIGRKSAIGTVITRQNSVRKIDRKELPIRRQPVTGPAITTRRIMASPSLA
ncbi:MAG: hypothetical protein PHY28_01250 [Dehalococcoidales bacterium]|nr:hypothetical protein [Dehalococcoidales bacterium]